MPAPKMHPSHTTFHRFWTKAVGTPGYDKKSWLALDQMLAEANRTDDATARAYVLREAERLSGQTAPRRPPAN